MGECTDSPWSTIRSVKESRSLRDVSIRLLTTVAVLTLNVVVSQVVRPWLCATLCVALALLCGTFGPARRADAASGVFAGATAISAGPFHACAVRVDGTVWCWGENGNGQLGTGNTTDSNVPVRVSGVNDAIAVTAGGSDTGASNGHTCMLRRSGGVLCWGDNISGQLGDGTTSDSPTPIKISGNHTFKQISAGRLHTCGVKFSGEALCWGANNVGQLGIGNVVTPQLDPVAMTGALASNVVEVSTGSFHTCGRTAAGTVHCTGSDGSGQLGDGAGTSTTSTPVQVTLSPLPSALITGGSHSCALVVTGEMRCWGSDTQGQIGNGATTGSQFSPVAVLNMTDAVGIGKSALGAHQCAVRVNTRVHCWGNNEQGQLGDGSTDDRDAPVAVQNLDGPLNTIIEVAAGLNFTCGLASLGDVWCWGDNAIGQLGDGTNDDSALAVPASAPDMFGSTQLTNGQNHTCFLPPLTRPHCAGDNISGQLGDGTKTQRLSPVLAGNVPMVEISAGGFHTCGIEIGGTVDCWGAGFFGQLGNGANLDSPTSVNASLLTGVVQISSGLRHTCALRYDGTVWCWGANHQGQLGNGNNDNQNTPQAVSGLSSLVEVSAGEFHTCARAANGQMACWGDNPDKQLGNTTTNDSNVPTDVLGEDNAIDIAAGGAHTCAVIADGSVRCFGRGDEGQIGDGQNVDAGTATPVSGTGAGGLRARSIVTGSNHSCALFQLGLVACWGENGSGQLGDDTNDDRNTPVFAELLEASVISAGGSTSCAKVEDERVRCWGSNVFGQFGNGTNAGSGDGLPVDTGLDSDLDGCADVEELAPDPAFGGDRSFVEQWDFYDVFLFGEEPNGSIDLSDTLDLLSLFGALPGELGYLPWLDRVAPDPVDPYRTALATDPGDLGIDLSDALLNLGSFGHSCVELP